MKTIFLLLPLFIIQTGTISIQKNVIEYFDRCSGSNIRLEEYSITNNSAEAYYTWVYYDDIVLQGNAAGLKQYLFKSPKDAINLATLLFDNVVFVDFKPTIGINFLKRLLPNERFVYVLYNHEDKEPFDKYIYYASESELNNLIGSIVNKQLLYDNSYIVVP